MAGAVRPTGEAWPFTNTDPRGVPHVWAPGFQVQVADGDTAFVSQHPFHSSQHFVIESPWQAVKQLHFILEQIVADDNTGAVARRAFRLTWQLLRYKRWHFRWLVRPVFFSPRSANADRDSCRAYCRPGCVFHRSRAA